ncbi:hypothetical protein PC128_g19033 [Phytophthora cactorum]|nr:hypothetical protein PC128_g19033 [Phytophthora cactorum]
MTMSAVDADAVPSAAVTDTLMGFYARFGHLALDTVERMGKDPASGIEITDRTRRPCLVCAQGKQTRARQQTKDNGAHAPIDKVGEVICSDLKGPMTPMDHLGNRYMVNFIDHKSNYCQVFLAKRKNEAAKMLQEFFVKFEKRFDCKVHVLGTDGGGEYRNVDLFCKNNGVARQVTEASNQAANTKAERMHRTVLNMAGCMVFDARLPLSFWGGGRGGAAQYAAYILNRSLCRANEGRKSPLVILTGRTPDLHEVVLFGTKCTVFSDPGKRSMTQRACECVTVGKDDPTKDYKVYLPSERKVITTRHVQNILVGEKTLNEEPTTAQLLTAAANGEKEESAA